MGIQKHTIRFVSIFLIAGFLSLMSTQLSAYASDKNPAENRGIESSTTVSNELQQSVSGTVTDAETGEPIPGANIYIDQLQTGSATDLEGRYEIQISEPGSYTLVATFVGYERYETTIDISGEGSLTHNIELAQTSILGEDIVVVGYGVQRRSDLTGSISSVSGDRLNEVSVSSLESALQGRSAGVYVDQGGNKPEDGASIRIRGNRSITANNDPLFVVDGVPVSGGIRDLNPQDVESIEILKDASATAIYGARGSNGVVLVTTKRGYDGDVSVRYDGSVGFSDMLRRVPMMNGEQWADVRREAFRAAGNPTPDESLFHPTELEQIQNGTWTDYQDMITQRGIRQEHQLGISGGNSSTRYHVSFGALDHNGILAPENFQRYNTRLNLDIDISDQFRIGTSTLGSYSIQDGSTVNFYQEAVMNTPLTQPYDENGQLRLEPKPDAQRTNPLLEVLPESYVDEQKIQRILSNIYAEYQPTDNLNFRVNFSPDFRSIRDNRFQAPRSRSRQGGPAAAQIRNIDTFEYTWENLVNWQEDLAEDHSINMTGLFSIQEFRRESPTRNNNGSYEPSVSVRGIPLNDMRQHNLGAAEEILSVSSEFSKWTLVSYMARANYNFADRYLITATGRMDGSSRFGSENQWGFFPSVAFAWNISNESFFNGGDLLNNLRLRLSWGQTGQTGIQPYQTQGLAERTAFIFGDTPAFGFKPSQIRNNNLKWETTTSTNLGLQFDMFSSRITGEVDLYSQNTSDLLLQRAIPTTSGYNSVLENVGKTRNSGIEASLTTRNIQSGGINGWQWTTNFSVAYNKEEIVELFGGEEDDVGNEWFIGQPVNVYYDWEKIGIWQLDEADEAAQYGQRPGEIKVRDVVDPGSITGDDRVILGQEYPKWQGGIGNQISYKGFDLSVFAVFRLGTTIESSIHRDGSNQLAGRYNNVNVDYWTPDNPTNAYPQPRADLERPVYNTTLSYFDGDFLRIRHITLGYNLPADLVQNIMGANTLRLSVRAENPFIFAPYVQEHNGVDPETASGTGTPSWWSLQFGLQLSF